MPENTYLTCEYNILKVRERESTTINHAVDIFLNSLAEDAGDSAIAVILSGGGEDGLAATSAVHQAGGKVFVQKPESAVFDGIPSAVVERDSPDKIMLPVDIAEELLYLINQLVR